MTDPNKHISEYLDYYCSMTESPEFGVLLKGEWGSGKTWFIEKFLDDQKELRHLYISLYGISSFAEIEDEFFRQLHPRLSSKGAKLAGKILKGLLRTTIKVDLDHDGKDDGSINSQVPDISLPEYLADIDNCILIFDDLERCKIDLENILGYINHFVEHQGFKAIVLAHEDELEKRVESSPVEYKRIKEKLIGKTFKVLPNVGSAIDDFTAKLQQVNAQDFLRAHKDFIIEVYTLSESNNLRALKQSLWDFERIYEALPEKARGVDELVQKILGHSLSYSLDIRVGEIAAKDILRSNADWMSAFMGKQSNSVEKSPSEKFVAKYRKLEPHRPIPPAEFWSEYFDKGTINAAELNTAIDNSVYFMTESMPNWTRLWHYMDLEDDELGPLLQEVWQQFERKELVEIGALIHVVGILLTLSDMRLLQKSKRTITALAKQHIDSLVASNKPTLVGRRNMVDLIASKTGYAGLGFHGNQLPEFLSVAEYLGKAQSKAAEEMMPAAAADFLNIMKSDLTKFSRMITLSNSEDQIYCDTPIFKYVDAKTFVSALLHVTPHDRRFVMYALEERYKHSTISVKLIEELEWLKKVKRLLGTEIAKRKGMLSAHAFRNVLSAIDEACEKLAALKVASQPANLPS